MQLRYALLASFANVSQEGHLNAMGILDRLFAYRFPVIHRELFVINSLATEPGDAEQPQEVRVSIIDADGTMVAEAVTEMQIQDERQTLNQVHVFQDLRFEKAGAHQVSFFINGALAHALDLDLIQVDEPR